MLTGAIHWLGISGSSQGRQVRGPTFLDKKHTHMPEEDAASFWNQDKLPAFAIFKSDQNIQTFSRQMNTQTDACRKQQATESILGCHRMLRTKRRDGLFFFLTVLLHLVCAKRAALLLSLTRARAEVVYTAIDRGRGRGRGRMGSRSPNSKVSWGKKAFRQCQFIHSNKKLRCFDSDFPLAQSYISIWDSYILQPLCCACLTEQLHLP